MEGFNNQCVLQGERLSDLVRLTWSNVNLSKTKKVLRFMQRKTKGKTTKAKVEIPIHEALEEYLLSVPTSGNPNAPLFQQLAQAEMRPWDARGLPNVAANLLEAL